MGMQGGPAELGKASAARLAVYMVLAVVVGALLGGLVDLRFGGDEMGAARGKPTRPEVAEAPPVEGVDMPVSEAVQVVGFGFTARSKVFCNGQDRDPSDGCEGCSIAAGCGIHPADEDHRATYGVVVRNSSDSMLKGIRLTISFFDAAGQPIGMHESYSQVGIARLHPGEELGLGEIADLDRGGATEMRVEVGDQAGWVSLDYARATADLASLVQLTVSDVSLHGFGAVDEDGEPLRWTVGFIVRTERPEDIPCPAPCQMSGTPQAVFYDRSGHIVGGSSGSPMDLGLGYGEIDVYSSEDLGLVDVDPDLTRVYVTDVGMVMA